MNKQELMMKAVCDLKDDIYYINCEVSPTEIYLFSFAGDSKAKYITSDRKQADDRYCLVCTVEEFNNLVSELSRAEWIPEKVNFNKGDFPLESITVSRSGCELIPKKDVVKQKRQISNLEKMQYMYDWQAGDMCIYKGIESLFIAYHPTAPCAVIENSESGIFTAMIDKLSKPLTQEQKAAKEREEAIGKIAVYIYKCDIDDVNCDDIDVIAKMYDAGLLKTEV
jgi:hypothetical protein